jgi:(p)ppGpp synthase/HD superfamily hydrolase
MEILGLKCSKNEGIKILEELLSETGLTSDPIIIRTLMQKFGYKHKHELYGAIGRGEISKRKLREIINIFLEELHGNLL